MKEKNIYMHVLCIETANVKRYQTSVACFSAPDTKCSHMLDNSDTGILRNMTWVLTSLMEWVSKTFFSNLCAHKAQMQLPTVLPRLPRLWI